MRDLKYWAAIFWQWQQYLPKKTILSLLKSLKHLSEERFKTQLQWTEDLEANSWPTLCSLRFLSLDFHVINEVWMREILIRFYTFWRFTIVTLEIQILDKMEQLIAFVLLVTRFSCDKLTRTVLTVWIFLPLNVQCKQIIVSFQTCFVKFVQLSECWDYAFLLKTILRLKMNQQLKSEPQPSVPQWMKRIRSCKYFVITVTTRQSTKNNPNIEITLMEIVTHVWNESSDKDMIRDWKLFSLNANVLKRLFNIVFDAAADDRLTLRCWTKRPFKLLHVLH